MTRLAFSTSVFSLRCASDDSQKCARRTCLAGYGKRFLQEASFRVSDV